MADFIISYKKTGIIEGGWADKPSDSGGQTWEGVSRNNFPQWQGWGIIDGYKHLPNFPASLKTAVGLEEMVQSFYRQNFWYPIKGDLLLFQEVADSIYDSAVNMGVGKAIQLVQDSLFELPDNNKTQAIRALGINYGHMDNKTLDKLNNKI